MYILNERLGLQHNIMDGNDVYISLSHVMSCTPIDWHVNNIVLLGAREQEIWAKLDGNFGGHNDKLLSEFNVVALRGRDFMGSIF